MTDSVKPDAAVEVDVPPGSEEHRSTVEKLKGQQKRLTERVDKTRAELEGKRKTNSFIDTAMSTVERDSKTGGPVLAGALAFRIFLFQIPYVFVMVILVSMVQSSSDRASREVEKAVGIGSLTASVLGDVDNLTGWNRLWALGLGTSALFFGARTFVKVLRTVHALIWQVPLTKQSSTKPGLVFIGVVTVALLLAGIASRAEADTLIGGIVLILIANAVFGGLFVLIALHMPRAEGTTWKDLVPGGIVVGVGALVLHVITVFWIAHELESKSERYGAIGAALALLLWAYLLGRLITSAAAVNHVRWERKAHKPLPLPPPAPGSVPVSE